MKGPSFKKHPYVNKKCQINKCIADDRIKRQENNSPSAIKHFTNENENILRVMIQIQRILGYQVQLSEKKESVVLCTWKFSRKQGIVTYRIPSGGSLNPLSTIAIKHNLNEEKRTEKPLVKQPGLLPEVISVNRPVAL